MMLSLQQRRAFGPKFIFMFAFLFEVSRVCCSQAGIVLPELQQVLAVVDTGFGQNDSLFRLNVASGSAELVGVIPYSLIQSLTSDSNNIIYAWDPSDGLLRIDPRNAATSVVNPTIGGGGINLQSLAFSPSGVLFGVTDRGDISQLVSIDVQTGIPTLVASSRLLNRLETVRGIEFVGDQLVGIAWSNTAAGSPFLDIDTISGALSEIGRTGTRLLNSLAQDSDGVLYAFQSVDGLNPTYKLVTLDSSTGQTENEVVFTPPFVGLRSFSVRALTVWTVPEPAAGTSMLVAALLFGGTRKRSQVSSSPVCCVPLRVPS